jgi:hypothetical protein
MLLALSMEFHNTTPNLVRQRSNSLGVNSFRVERILSRYTFRTA